MQQTPERAPGQAGPAHDRLESWKEIATYLNRAVRTVQRWARDSGLPVHRLATVKRGAIYAYKSEIDIWWQSRSSSLLSEPGANAAAARIVRRNVLRWLALGTTAIVVLVTGMAARLVANSRSLEIATVRRLTFDGAAITPALSPDEKWVAYASPRATSDGNLHLWLQAVDGGAPSRLTETSSTNEFDPVFSPDSTHVLYSVTTRRPEPMVEIAGPPPLRESSLFESDLLGHAREVVTRASYGRYSPDGHSIAVLHESGGPGDAIRSVEVGVINSSGGALVPIHIGLSADDRLVAASPPVWSPDGKYLLVNARTRQSDFEWWLLSLTSRAAVRTDCAARLASVATGSATPFPLANLAPQAWLEDGTVLTKAFGPKAVSIWTAKLSPETRTLTTRPVPLTTPVHETRWLSTFGRRIVFGGGDAGGGLTSVPFDLVHGRQLAAPHAIREQNPGGYAELSISHDGRTLAFISRQASGRAPEAFTLDLRSGDEKRFSEDRAPVAYPAISADGTKLAYGVVRPAGRQPIYVAARGSQKSVLLCDDCGGQPAEWTTDGKGLLITRAQFHPQRIGLLELASGKATDILQHESLALRDPRIAPDGGSVVFLSSDGGAFVAPFRGRNPVPDREWQPIERPGARIESAFWSPDGKRLYWMVARERNQAVIRTRSFDSARGALIGSAVDIFAMDWHPALGQTVTMNVVAGTGQLIIPTSEVQSDVWIGRLQRTRWRF